MENSKLTSADVEAFRDSAMGVVTDCHFYQNLHSFIGQDREVLIAAIRKETRNNALLLSIFLPIAYFSWSDRAGYLRAHGIDSKFGPLFARIDSALTKMFPPKPEESDEDQ